MFAKKEDMIPENETYLTSPEILLEAPEKVAVSPTVESEMTDVNSTDFTDQIDDVNPGDYNLSLNNLMVKYAKTKK